MWGGLVAATGNSRTAYETLWPLRAENSAMLAFKTLKAGGGSVPIIDLKPVNVKKLLSIPVLERLVVAGTTKSVRISGSLAIALPIMAKDAMKRKKILVAILE